MKKIVSKEVDKSLFIDKLPGYFLILCLLVSIYFLFGVVAPFVTVISVSAVLVITFYPLYSMIVRLFRGRKALASAISCLLVIVVIIIPIGVFILMMASEGVTAYDSIRAKVESGFFDKFLQWKEGGFLYDLKNQIDPIINLDGLDIKQNIISAAQNVSTFLVSQTTTLIKSLSGILMSLVILLFSMFFLFKDGDKIVARIGYLSPLPSKYEAQLFSKLKDMVNAIIVGGFFTAIIQGTLCGIGFAIAGVPSPVFWGAVTAFLAFVPMIGTFLVWGPAGIIMIASGDYQWGIFILVWGALIVGLIDNFTKPLLIGRKAHTYPLLTFFVILGGIFTMGFKGIIVGPIVLMAFMSLLHIYETEYSKVLKQ
ncbi:MAG: AI-2E family transporter [Candidatus Gracilibacteria bacterium]|jgi:predicted PurR-regulated permease PerM